MTTCHWGYGSVVTNSPNQHIRSQHRPPSVKGKGPTYTKPTNHKHALVVHKMCYAWYRCLFTLLTDQICKKKKKNYKAKTGLGTPKMTGPLYHIMAPFKNVWASGRVNAAELVQRRFSSWRTPHRPCSSVLVRAGIKTPRINRPPFSNSWCIRTYSPLL